MEETISRYLVDRVAALPNVELHIGKEVVALEGDNQGLVAATFRDGASGEDHRRVMRHLFLYIGAELATEWAAGCLDMDGKDFHASASALVENVAEIALPLRRT